MARGLCAPMLGRRWIALTTSAALFHSSTLLGVLRAQSYSPQVLLCQMLRYSPVWHQVSLFLCSVIPLLPFPSPRIIHLLQSTFWVLRGAGRQPKGGMSLWTPMGGLQDLPQGSNLRGEEIQPCVSACPVMTAGSEVLPACPQHSSDGHTDSTDFVSLFF